ncbi:MAG: PorT family protein [Ignavibacteria bacterium]|nr:PorT family protein [Ignavibacteria bacterium]
MKTIITTITICLIFGVFATSKAQMLAIGIEGGVNFGNISVTPTTTTSSRTGVIFGSLLDINISPRFAITPGVRYVMKGWSNTDNGVTYTDKLSYIEVPVYAKVNFPLTEVKPFLAFAPVLAIQVSATEDQSNGTQSASVDISSLVETIDFDLLFAGGIDFKVAKTTSLFFQAAYELGLTNILKNSQTTTIKNYGLQLTGGVKFGL